MLPVVELFTSIQGEGKYIGVPSHFLRVSGCNLRCVFKDSICDTACTSFNPEKPIYKDFDELINSFDKLCTSHPNVHHLVITGGEPLLYRDDLEKFLEAIAVKNMVITIETNGTQKPISGVNLYSVSPKLKSSVGTPGVVNNVNVTKDMCERQEKYRINIENLVNIITQSQDYQLKFVYSGEGCIEEIDSIITRVKEYTNKLSYFNRMKLTTLNNHIMLMPEGINNEQLAMRREEIANKCIDKGWVMTDREHIIIWGDKRYV